MVKNCSYDVRKGHCDQGLSRISWDWRNSFDLYPFHIKPIMRSQRRFENNAVWCERSESALCDTGVKKAAFNVGGLQLPREVFWKRILAKSRSLRWCGCQCEKVYRIMRRERPKVIPIPALVTVCMDGKRGWQKPTKNRRNWRER